MKNRHAYLPGILVGIPAGLLSSFEYLNACCCIWTMSAGLVAVYFVQNKADDEIPNTEGMTVGMIAGLLSGLIYGLNNAILEVMQLSALPSDKVSGDEQLNAVVGLICGGFVLQPFFGALGGLIGASVINKSPPPTAQTGPVANVRTASPNQEAPSGLSAHPARPRRPGFAKDDSSSDE